MRIVLLVVVLLQGYTPLQKHHLQVVGGDGTGDYPSMSVQIRANAPLEGMVFSQWSAVPDDTEFANHHQAVTFVRMKDHHVVVTAHYQHLPPPPRTGEP